MGVFPPHSRRSKVQLGASVVLPGSGAPTAPRHKTLGARPGTGFAGSSAKPSEATGGAATMSVEQCGRTPWPARRDSRVVEPLKLIKELGAKACGEALFWDASGPASTSPRQCGAQLGGGGGAAAEALAAATRGLAPSAPALALRSVGTVGAAQRTSFPGTGPADGSASPPPPLPPMVAAAAAPPTHCNTGGRQAALGARSFWHFVAELLQREPGALSRAWVADAGSAELAQRGAELVLGSPSPTEGVKAVAATQRWATVLVPDLAKAAAAAGRPRLTPAELEPLLARYFTEHGPLQGHPQTAPEGQTPKPEPIVAPQAETEVRVEQVGPAVGTSARKTAHGKKKKALQCLDSGCPPRQPLSRPAARPAALAHSSLASAPWRQPARATAGPLVAAASDEDAPRSASKRARPEVVTGTNAEEADETAGPRKRSCRSGLKTARGGTSESAARLGRGLGGPLPQADQRGEVSGHSTAKEEDVPGGGPPGLALATGGGPGPQPPGQGDVPPDAAVQLSREPGQRSGSKSELQVPLSKPGRRSGPKSEAHSPRTAVPLSKPGRRAGPKPEAQAPSTAVHEPKRGRPEVVTGTDGEEARPSKRSCRSGPTSATGGTSSESAARLGARPKSLPKSDQRREVSGHSTAKEEVQGGRLPGLAVATGSGQGRRSGAQLARQDDLPPDIAVPPSKQPPRHRLGPKSDGQEKRCSICGSADNCGPLSCPDCTAALLEDLGPLNFTLGQRVWCRGFGPMWPAKIEAVGFQSRSDKEPWCVRFYGEKSIAWVGDAKLVPWRSREPVKVSSLPSRYRKAMEVALKVANDDEAARKVDEESATPPEKLYGAPAFSQDPEATLSAAK